MSEGATDVRATNLAKIITYSAGVTPGATVLIDVHTGGEALAALVKAECQAAGAGVVLETAVDHHQLLAELTANPEQETFTFTPDDTEKWERVRADDGCVIMLRADPDPDQFADVLPAFRRWYPQMWAARAGFKEHGIERNEHAWTLFLLPTEAAIKRTFTDLAPEQATTAYWDAVYEMTGATAADPIATLKAKNELITKRKALLNKLALSKLHFSNPENGTDLTVGLPKTAQWLGGENTALGTQARTYTLNVPTYEVFTTPDWRTVDGIVAATKPTNVRGRVVREARFTFKKGVVTAVTAKQGLRTLDPLLITDPGANRMGEIALVGLDSPCARQNQVFYSLLFDENAACHFALGSAYVSALRNSDELEASDLDRLGVNQSCVHQDFMISDEHTTVRGQRQDGEWVTLIENGQWVNGFAPST